MRSLDLPVIDDPKGLAAAVQAEAPDHIPMPMDEAVVDFQSLGVVETPAGPRSRVVIVAVRREMIERLVSAAREAGLEVEGIDLAAFGMVRALAPAGTERAILYVNVAGLTNVAVANGSGCLFTRAAAGGLDAAVHTLSERRALTLEHARQWMQHVGLLPPLEDVEGDAELVGGHPRRARGGRAPARRHRAQLAELLPDAGGRRDRRARPADRARRRHPGLRREARRAAQAARRAGGRRGRRRRRGPTSAASPSPPGWPSKTATSRRAPRAVRRGRGAAP